MASLVFYAWGEPVYIWIMLFSTFSDYVHGILIDRFRSNKKLAKNLVFSAIVVNLLLLGYFKYIGFFARTLKGILPIFSNLYVPEVSLPIGISFYTFQTMSYSIDIYQKNAEVKKNMFSFGAYVTLFPQLIAGPIVRYKDVATQLDDKKRESIFKFSKGIRLFLIGLSKKVLLANSMGEVWNFLKESPDKNGTTASWVGLVAYSFQMYFDFSGYSDMACGLGNMFGFEFIKNFDYPFISKSITEFWRRWHISLSIWFKEYVYIPLGGNKVSKIRNLFNIFLVWFLTGLWHGSNFNYVLWGIYFGLILILEKFLLLKIFKKIPTFLQHTWVIFVILLSWVIFSFEDENKMLAYAKSVFSCNDQNLFFSKDALNIFISYLPLLIICVISSTPFGSNIFKKMKKNNFKLCSIVELALILISLILCTSSLLSQSYNPFLYFRF
jgi:alginate O-acetyltransferase complex protein AlgI